MQLLPMASSPDGLISARYAVITKTPGGGGGAWVGISEFPRNSHGIPTEFLVGGVWQPPLPPPVGVGRMRGSRVPVDQGWVWGGSRVDQGWVGIAGATSFSRLMNESEA